jgi:serine/threonine-protein kinase
MLRRVMELLVKLGEKADALYVYKKLAERLRREFDAEPSPETRALYDRIRWGRT